jgi:CRP-like cAMP-binding protein
LTPPATPAHARLIRRLETVADLTPAEKRGLSALPLETRRFPENTDIVREGDRPSHCCLIVSGFVCRYKVLGEGQRQIVHFHMAGDIPDLQSLHLEVMDHSMGTLTPVTAAFIPHAAVHALIREHPRIGSAFWKQTLIDASVFREWLVGVGRRSAHQRVGHLICELSLRMTSVGLADGKTLQLPITQAEVADALGLSSVHVNRVLQDLRRDGLISGQGKTFVIGDWERLAGMAEFNPVYLHIRKIAV